MNKPNLDAFLLGVAEDQQHRACEELLSNPETIVDFQTEVGEDSLISALHMAGTSTCDTPELESLVEQVEQLVPRHSISTDELKRFLDPPDSSDELGKIDRFRIIEFLASGGMGLVFRAVDPNLEREVCLKLLRPDLEFNVEAKSRFERESREVARMGSERIVSVLEVGRQRGLPFFVMPMLEGMSLRSLLDKQGKLAAKRAMQITRQLAQGLLYAHDRNLLHRDIKPDNLWLTTTGDVIVLDFGLVRSTNDANEMEPPITRQGTVIGTPSYMSPEQVTGKELDQRSDLFSVGVVLVEMLTGESPFKKANLFSTMMSVAGDEIQIAQLDLMADVPVGLAGLAQRLLHKNPDDRIESALELIQVLDQVEGSPYSSLDSASPSQTHGSKWLKYVAAGMIGVLLSGIAIAAWVVNDKGKLVVSANDPEVEIKIAGEQVSVHDPVSNRSYKIQIGETPLPSGVYQLETKSLDGGLVFSSQTIAIRRGKKTIVTVELVEPDSASATTASEMNLLQGAKQAWRDRTRVPEAYVPGNRASLINRVQELPSLSLADIGFDTSPAFSDKATVRHPKNLNGIKAWSVERLAGREMEYYPNCDRTLFVGKGKAPSRAAGFVRIMNSTGELCAALPIPGRVNYVRWCDDAHDLIAVSSWVGEFDENASNLYAITIWQITPTGARLLRSVRTSDRSFNWDSGYRIICLIDDQLSAFRIDNGTIWSMPEASKGEFLYDGAISPDGRFVATYSLPSKKSQVSIWDLKSAKFLMAIPSGTSFQWGSNSQNIAVDVRRLFGNQNDDENSLEIWNIDRQQMTKSFTKQESAKSQISPDLTTIAVKQKSGDIVLTDVSTRREKSIAPPEAFIAKTDGQFSVRWKSEYKLELFQSDGEWSTVWTREHTKLSGRFGSIVMTPKIDQSQANRFEFTEFRMTNIGELAIMGASQPTNDRSIAVSIDVASNSIVRNASFSNLDWPKQKSRYFGTIKQPGTDRHMISPSGKFVLAWADSEPSNNPRSFKNLRVVELGKPDRALPIFDMERIFETAWNDDESLLIVRGIAWDRGRSRFACKVVDLKNWAEHKVNGLPTELAGNFHAWNDGFVCRVAATARRNQRDQKWKLGYLGPKPNSDFRTFDEEFNYVWFKKLDGDDVVFGGQRFDESDQQSNSSLPTQYFKLLKNFQIVEVPASSVTVQDSKHYSYSFDGKFQIQQNQFDDQEKTRVKVPTLSIYRSENQVDKGSRNGNAFWTGEVREFQWHPTSNSAIWRTIDNRGWQIFNPENMVEPRLITGSGIAKPNENGWHVMTSQGIQQIGLEGQVLGSFSIDQNATGDLANPVWVFPDGAVIGNAESLHVLCETKQEFQVKAFPEFQKNFSNATSSGSKTILMRINPTPVK